ncbi:aspartate kinase, partial [Candidatus Bathyarchaeota archaeon]|nr:aspartate kinase [Candidatus Bathyarchaeota archaeon]
MRLLVMKFGGSCLTDGDSVLRAAELVRDAFNGGDRIVTVVSAMRGVTDRLLNMVEGSLRGEDVSEEIEALRADHVEATRRAVGDVEVRGEVERIVITIISELERVLTAIGYLGEVTPRSRDYILSFGERLSTPILWGAIRSQGLKASWMTG